MFHVEHLKLWFPRQDWGTGFGDHIQIMSVVPHWQAKHPGAPVTVAYQRMRNTEAIWHFPGVEYIECDRAPDGDYLNGFHHNAWPPRDEWWQKLGLDWEDKRFWYWLTDHEAMYAQTVWQAMPRPWVVVQATGGMAVKRWHGFGVVADELSKETGGTVLVMDTVGTYQGRLPVIGRGRVRDAVAIAATADMFVGWDSGPFYAAIGRLVPSVGIFSVFNADKLYYPVTAPATIALEGKPAQFVVADVMRSARQLLEATYDVGRPYRCFRSGWAFQ